MNQSLLYFSLFFTQLVYAQSNNPGNNEQISKRISFITGVGASYVCKKLYADPVINPTNNTVQIQSAQKTKTNLTLGAAYIFGKAKTEKPGSTTHSVVGETQIDQTVGEDLQHGFTFALFLNPLLISKITESQNFFNITDFGFGLGHTFPGGFVIMGTTEFFSVSQPRNWFLDQFKDKNITYTISNEMQKSIDVNDHNIFTSKVVMTFGIKFAYSFNTIKKFVSTTTTPTGKDLGNPTTIKTYL